MSAPANELDIRPLGTLAPTPGGQEWSGGEIDTSSTLAAGLRECVAAYLAGCPVFLAWMEYTRDVIGDRFGVSGGSAIASDGVYYWRVDAVEYIREYGVAVPQDALDHFEEVSWRPPKFSRVEYLTIYKRLDSMLGGAEVVD